MKEQKMTVTEAARGFSDLVNRVRYRGESALLMKNGHAVARIVPVGPAPMTGKELARRWTSILSPGEAEALERDIEAGRALLKPLPTPWE